MADDASKSTVIHADTEDAKRYWLAEGWSPGGHIREVDYAANSKGVDPLFQGIKIVDCDTHFTEPPDMFTKNAPARFKGKMPRVERVDNIAYWFVGDKNFGSALGGNVIGADHNKLLGRLAFQNHDQITTGAWQLKPRLAEMDAMGVWAQICFQNSGVTQAGSLVALEGDLGITILKTYNDVCAEWQRDSGGRINGMASLPYWDKDLLNQETRRIIDMGMKGVVMPDRPERIGVSGFLGPDGKCSPYWEEFFETCEATGTPLNFHLNSSLDAELAMWDNLGFDQRLPMSAMLHHIGCAATMSIFMISGMLDRFPKLKIGLIESGCGWVPFILEAMEHQMDEFRIRENRHLQRRPKEYFKQFWVSYWFESYGPKHMLEEIGVDRLMFETDFPHPTSLYPGVQAKLVDTLGGYDYAIRKKVLETNAAELYNLKF